jgi:hypothetical protein
MARIHELNMDMSSLEIIGLDSECLELISRELEPPTNRPPAIAGQRVFRRCGALGSTLAGAHICDESMKFEHRKHACPIFSGLIPSILGTAFHAVP